MAKILFILGNKQQLVDIGQGGEISPEATVLWDERVRGPLECEAPLAMDVEDYEDPVFEIDGTTPVYLPELDENGHPVIVDNEVVYSNVQKTITKRRLVFSQSKADANAALTAYRNQIETNMQARAYLASTDWYVTRFAETQVAIPQDILSARAAARASVVE